MWTSIFTGLSLVFVLSIVFLVRAMNKVIEHTDHDNEPHMPK